MDKTECQLHGLKIPLSVLVTAGIQHLEQLTANGPIRYDVCHDMLQYHTV